MKNIGIFPRLEKFPQIRKISSDWKIGFSDWKIDFLKMENYFLKLENYFLRLENCLPDWKIGKFLRSF